MVSCPVLLGRPTIVGKSYVLLLYFLSPRLPIDAPSTILLSLVDLRFGTSPPNFYSGVKKSEFGINF